MVWVLLMLIEKGVTALPVHDAVLVRHDRADAAAATMAVAFEELAGAPAVRRGGQMVPGGGIEPPTLRFSVACSTN